MSSARAISVISVTLLLISGHGKSSETYTAADREAIARVAFAEAGTHPVDVAAVIDVIVNRVASGQFGATAEAVVNAAGQFEVVSRATGDWRRLPPLNSRQRAMFETIWALKQAGQLGSIVGDATYFQNPVIVAERARRGTVRPELVHFGGMPSVASTPNGHVFYAPKNASHPRTIRNRRKPLASMAVIDPALEPTGGAGDRPTVLIPQETSLVMPEPSP